MGNSNPKMKVKNGLEARVNIYEQESENKKRELEDKMFGLRLKHPRRMKQKSNKIKFISDMKNQNHNDNQTNSSINNVVKQARKEQDEHVYNFSKKNLQSEINDRKYGQLERLYSRSSSRSESFSRSSSISSSISEGSRLALNQKRDELFNAVRHNNFDRAEEILYEDDKHKHLTDKYGNTLLHVACQNNSKRLVKLVLKLGVNIDARNADGQTALHYCFVYKYNKLGWYLMSKGANNGIKNKYGLLPQEGLSYDKYAKKSKHAQNKNNGNNNSNKPKHRNNDDIKSKSKRSVQRKVSTKKNLTRSRSTSSSIAKPAAAASYLTSQNYLSNNNNIDSIYPSAPSYPTGKLEALKLEKKISNIPIILSNDKRLPPLKIVPKKLPPLKYNSNHMVAV